MLVTDDSTGVNVGGNSFTSSSSSNSVHYGFGLSSNGTLIEETVCVGGVNDGRACSAYNDLCNSYESWMLSAACGAGTVLYESVLHFLATCSCVQGRKRFQNNCCGSRVKMVIESLGGLTLVLLRIAWVRLYAVHVGLLLRQPLCFGVAARVIAG